MLHEVKKKKKELKSYIKTQYDKTHFHKQYHKHRVIESQWHGLLYGVSTVEMQP